MIISDTGTDIFHLTGDAYRRLMVCCSILVTAGTILAAANITLHPIGPNKGDCSPALNTALLMTVPQLRRDRQGDVTATEAADTTDAPTQPTETQPPPEGAKPVITLTMTPSSSSEHYGSVYVHNESGRKYDAEELLAAVSELRLNASGQVQVLIYHTHGTEAYNNDGLAYYGDSYYSTRSKNTSENVVHIGDVLASELEKRGIGVLHDRTMYDDPQYTGAYLASGKSVKEYLSKYPTIQLVIDLHRDTIITSSGTKYRPVTQTRYGQTAQIMIISAAGKTADPNPKWKENFATALRLQKHASVMYSGLMRPLLLRNSMYNQHLHPGAFLAEVGTCGNTVTEAENAAKCLADIICSAYLE